MFFNRQARRLPGVADRQYHGRRELGWHLARLGGVLWRKSLHLPRRQAHRGRLERKIGHRLAGVVPRDARFELSSRSCRQPDHGEHQHRRRSGPRLIERVERGQQRRKRRGTARPRRDDETPRLFVARRRRPACGFEQAAKIAGARSRAASNARGLQRCRMTSRIS